MKDDQNNLETPAEGPSIAEPNNVGGESPASTCSAIWMRSLMRSRYQLAKELSKISSLYDRDIIRRDEIKKQIEAIDAQTDFLRMPMMVMPNQKGQRS